MNYILTEEVCGRGTWKKARHGSRGLRPIFHCRITVRSFSLFLHFPSSLWCPLPHCQMLSRSVRMIERLSNASLWAVLNHVRRDFIDFLELPRHKQMTLAEKATDVLVREIAFGNFCMGGVIQTLFWNSFLQSFRLYNILSRVWSIKHQHFLGERFLRGVLWVLYIIKDL